MRVGEHYARLAEDSTKTMEKWTVKMYEIAAKTERETNSMHGITVLTLIFLPGTFVSVSAQSLNNRHTTTKNLTDNIWELCSRKQPQSEIFTRYFSRTELWLTKKNMADPV